MIYFVYFVSVYNVLFSLKLYNFYENYFFSRF